MQTICLFRVEAAVPREYLVELVPVGRRRAPTKHHGGEPWGTLARRSATLSSQGVSTSMFDKFQLLLEESQRLQAIKGCDGLACAVLR